MYPQLTIHFPILDYRKSLSPEKIAAIEQHCADFNRVFRYW